MVLYGICNYVYLYELSNHTNDHGQYSCWFAILYFVLPIRMLLGCVTDNVKRDERIKYSEAKFTFPQDYDRTNPMSANKARARYLQEIKDKKMKHASEEEKKKIDDELEKLKNKDGFDSIMKYCDLKIKK